MRFVTLGGFNFPLQRDRKVAVPNPRSRASMGRTPHLLMPSFIRMSISRTPLAPRRSARFVKIKRGLISSGWSHFLPQSEGALPRVVASVLQKFCAQRHDVTFVTSSTTRLPETSCHTRALGALHSPPRVKQDAAFRATGASPMPSVAVQWETP